MERETGFEPATSTLARSHSTTELLPLVLSFYSTCAFADNSLHPHWHPLVIFRCDATSSAVINCSGVCPVTVLLLFPSARMPSIRHLRCSPHHPQTNGKLERFHQTIKARLNVLVYPSPEALQRAIAEFLEYYNQRGYHDGIGNVAPADVYYGRREEILRRREEQKQRTLEARLRYNLERSEPEGDSGLESVACP
jgi:Integrase core domain